MSWQIALSVGSTLFSAYSSVQQGKAQQEMYKLQAAQTEAEAARKALAYEERANNTLRDLNRSNGALIAQGFGGGVRGFSGSTALVTSVNTRNAGIDFQRDLDNATNTISTGNLQSDIFGVAGETAYRGKLLDAGSKLLAGGVEFSKTYKTSATPKETPKG
jgi:hypothetical protein